MTSHIKDLFVPAAGVQWLTPCYDPAMALLTRERTWRPHLVNQIAPRTGERVLDLGCGTGALTVMIQQACPAAEVIGLDIDRDALRVARAKARIARTPTSFWHAQAGDPLTVPMFRSRSFDKIVSNFLFQRWTVDQKFRALAYAGNILRSGGELHILYWAEPANRATRVLMRSWHALGAISRPPCKIQSSFREFMERAGFSDIAETYRQATVLGTVCAYRGAKK